MKKKINDWDKYSGDELKIRPNQKITSNENWLKFNFFKIHFG